MSTDYTDEVRWSANLLTGNASCVYGHVRGGRLDRDEHGPVWSTDVATAQQALRHLDELEAIARELRPLIEANVRTSA